MGEQGLTAVALHQLLYACARRHHNTSNLALNANIYTHTQTYTQKHINIYFDTLVHTTMVCVFIHQRSTSSYTNVLVFIHQRSTYSYTNVLPLHTPTFYVFVHQRSKSSYTNVLRLHTLNSQMHIHTSTNSSAAPPSLHTITPTYSCTHSQPRPLLRSHPQLPLRNF